MNSVLCLALKILLLFQLLHLPLFIVLFFVFIARLVVCFNLSYTVRQIVKNPNKKTKVDINNFLLHKQCVLW